MSNIIRSIKKRLGKSRGNQGLFRCEPPVHVDKRTKLSAGSFVGKYSYIGQGTVFGDIQMGRFCSVANDFAIISGNHPLNHLTTHPFTYNNEMFGDAEEYRDIDCKRSLESNPVHDTKPKCLNIGNDVWIGTKAIILGNVKCIGNGAVIGAGAIVTKDVPPFAVVAGNPAKIIKYRFDDETIQALEELKWWDLPLARIKHLDFSNVKFCIEELRSIRKGAGQHE